jgi:hypothetical protein
MATLALGSLAAATPALAQSTLTIQSDNSTLSLSNYTAFVGQISTTLTGGEQGTGSLTASQTGTIGIVSFNPSTNQLTFSTSGTGIISNNSGSWSPDVGGATGLSPANYGATGTSGIFTGQSAFRDSRLTLTQNGPAGSQGPTLPAPNPTDPTVTLTPTGTGTWTFPANSLSLQYTISNLDLSLLLNGSPAASGRDTLGDGTNGIYAQISSGTGMLQDLGGGNFSLTLPVTASFNYTDGSNPATANVFNYTLSGTVVATGQISPVPEPATALAITAAGALGFGLTRRRRGTQSESEKRGDAV